MTKSDNTNLHRAKSQKNDEFYTRYEDIDRELVHYTHHFKDKVVYCNCDSESSNFYHWFKDKFDELGLKELICTHYSADGPAQKIIINDKGIESRTPLVGNGDFRSEECISLLQEADIVVTNPPFSLFREFVGTLMRYGNKFLVIGSLNAITYKEIFHLIQTNNLWLGNTHVTTFIQPVGAPKKFGNILWYTNLDHESRHKELVLTKQYHSAEYHKYDNYEALHIESIKDIPSDYLGVMAVPITYLEHYNPEEYEILGDTRYHDNQSYADDINYIDGKQTYRRVLIRRIEHNQDSPRYDNYDCINVDRVTDIPNDYYGVIGVPITYLEKHNPDRFKVIGLMTGGEGQYDSRRRWQEIPYCG